MLGYGCVVVDIGRRRLYDVKSKLVKPATTALAEKKCRAVMSLFWPFDHKYTESYIQTYVHNHLEATNTPIPRRHTLESYPNSPNLRDIRAPSPSQLP
jgi:hypothetical protein